MPKDIDINTLLDPMREMSWFNTRLWLTNHQQRRGGALILLAALDGHQLIEASFCSEGILPILRPTRR